MNDIECPYCGSANQVCHDDGDGYAEGMAHEMECSDCKKRFVFHTTVSFNYDPKKADCLNGSAHRFGEWFKIWGREGVNETQKRYCADCEESEQRTVPKTP